MDTKVFIDSALLATGLTLEELAERLDYKSLKRARLGEIPLPDSKRKHIKDIVRVRELERRVDTNLGNVLREDPPQIAMQASYVVATRTEVGGSPRERLRAALREAGLTPTQAAKRMGYDAGVIEGVVNGGGRISEPMAEKFVEVLDHGLTVEELLEGSDTPRILGGSGRGTVGARSATVMPGGRRVRFVPRLSWARAGLVADAAALDEAFDGEGVETTVPGRAFAVEIAGDSMYPEISPGDCVVVRADDAARPGQLVLVRTIHGDVLCKRYSTKDGNRLVILSSVNKTYEPIEIPAEEIAWIYPVRQVIKYYM